MGQRLDDAANTRSMLLAAALLEQGHEVTMWTSAYDHIRKVWRQEWLLDPGGYRRDDGLHIKFMKGCGYKKNISLNRFVDHWLAGRDLQRQAATMERPDAIIASIPDHITADAAARVAKQRGVPLIVDVRDKWPDIFIDNISHPLGSKLLKLGLSYERHRARRTLRQAAAIVAMMESMHDWGLSRANRRKTENDRVFYLTTCDRNFGPEASAVPLSPNLQAVIDACSGKLIFAFVGTFNRTQHPMLILDAIDLLQHRGALPDNVAVVIGGDGIQADEVRERAAKLENVHSVGWLSSEQLAALLRHADIGLLPMNFPSPAFNNKAFSYMASGLPIINGATGDLADLIVREGVGINVCGGNVPAFADAIVELARSPSTIEAMTRNMRTLFETSFDRETNYAAYAKHVEAVAAEAA
jgi:glycosyltransferase involved in cell wall biosynthesis